MSSDPRDKELRYRIERKFARLRDEHVAAPDEKVGAVDSLKDIRMPERMNAGDITVSNDITAEPAVTAITVDYQGNIK